MITSAFCNSAKLEMLQGIHLASHTYKVALYTSAASLDKTTTAYSVTNEVVGAGYSAGGVALAGYAAALAGDIAYIDWTDPSWAAATITARGLLIYNDTLVGKNAVAVIDFGADYTSTNGTFLVTLPAAGAAAIVRIA